MPLGMAMQALASLGLLILHTDSPYAVMWPPYVLLVLGVGMVMSASPEAVVGNAPVKDGGVAGGLQATALQVGGALGTSVLISLISSRVGARLTGSLLGAGVPAPVADGLAGAKDAVAMGVAPVSADMPAQLRAAVAQGAGDAFMNGLHAAALVTAVLCVVAGIVSVIGVRRNPALVDA